MSSQPTTTKYIYKIAPSNPAIPVVTSSSNNLPPNYILPVSDLDRSSGFIHMSTAAQIPGTLLHFFPTSASERNSVYLLRAPLSPLEDQGSVKWESPDAKIAGLREGEGMFPHIYRGEGLSLRAADVEGVVEVVSGVGEVGWEKALGRQEEWLV